MTMTTISDFSEYLSKLRTLQKHKQFRDTISAQDGIGEEIRILDKMISEMESDLAESIHDVENYARSIDDVQVRVAFRLHYINGMSWSETAHAMGSITRQGVRSMVRRYISGRN